MQENQSLNYTKLNELFRNKLYPIKIMMNKRKNQTIYGKLDILSWVDPSLHISNGQQ